mgnify:CR=1 FL=1
MAFDFSKLKTLSGKATYYKYKECTPGQVLVNAGKYKGAEQGKYGIQHHFSEYDTEAKVVLNSSKMLDKILESDVSEGDIVRVVYLEKTVGKTGTEYHSFEISSAKDDADDVFKTKTIAHDVTSKVDEESSDDML